MDKRILKTKTAIQQSYFSLVAEKQSSRITITEITRRANLDRKTFYLHYDSPEDIIREFSEERIRHLLERLEAQHFFETPLNSSLFFSSLNLLIEEDLPLYKILAANPVFNFFWERVQETIISTIMDLYHKYPSLIHLPPEHLRIYSLFYASGLMNLYKSCLRGEIEISLKDLSALAGTISYAGPYIPAEESVSGH